MARICPLTDSADLQSVHTDISTTENFEYDANGNTIYNHNQEGFREMFWDESNRLRVVYDQNSYQMQHYIYDAAGERTLKASSKIENVYENGQVESNNTTMGLYTTYVSPYMVVDANQKYSKHYFNGTQRVASKIGEQDIAIFENGNQYLKQANSKEAENTPSTDFDTLKNKQITDFSYYLSKSTNNATAKNVKVKYTEYKKVDTNTETASAKAADNNSIFAAQQYAEIYYYHSDHLGTGTFLSDFDGNPYQFFLNLPFGETMAEQHSYSGEYTNRYKFNGKELDEETGFYYYGVRYYNPKYSIWLSVDPLAEEFPNWNPYNYCMQNPINLIDPTGMSPEGDPVNPPKDAKEGQTHSEHRNSITYNYTYESGSWTESEAIIDTVVINRNVKNASGVSNSSLWRYVPIIGSGLDSYDAFSKGEYLKGTAYLALAVSDVFLVKSLAVGTGKFALRSLAKTSASVVDDVATKGGSIALKGFTQHAAAESAITRGFKTADILKICKEGTQEVIRNGSQIRYTLQGNSIVVQQTGRNAGKVVTVFSNSPGTAKGLGKGAFIPWK